MMDALDRLLELARAEAAWSAEGFTAFADGLRERARVVLDERVASLERESAWLKAEVAGLKGEAQALRTARETATESHEKLLAHHRDVVAGLNREAQALRAAWDTAAESHEKLLAHHRQVVAHAVERLTAAARLPVWKFRERRTLLEASAALFAHELP